jgi:secondary thiamine-phosphate synthase enzyme
MTHSLEVRTRAHAELHEITREVQELVTQAKVQNGYVIAYVPHTTAGITINENADPTVKSDMLGSLEKIVPWEQPHFRHGEGNSAAHVKASMMGFSVTVFIEQGELKLGTWQGIYLCEFDGPRSRQVWIKIVAD